MLIRRHAARVIRGADAMIADVADISPCHIAAFFFICAIAAATLISLRRAWRATMPLRCHTAQCRYASVVADARCHCCATRLLSRYDTRHAVYVCRFAAAILCAAMPLMPLDFTRFAFSAQRARAMPAPTSCCALIRFMQDAERDGDLLRALYAP